MASFGQLALAFSPPFNHIGDINEMALDVMSVLKYLDKFVKINFD
jgi:hypothetical protein